jgi:hypothetical protein
MIASTSLDDCKPLHVGIVGLNKAIIGIQSIVTDLTTLPRAEQFCHAMSIFL